MRASIAADAHRAIASAEEDFPPGCNVVQLRLNLLPRHLDQAAAWVRAGSRMGLLDAALSDDDGAVLLVWVRETPEPAYLVRPVAMNWVVTDRFSGRQLGAFRGFGQALSCIRPVHAR